MQGMPARYKPEDSDLPDHLISGALLEREEVAYLASQTAANCGQAAQNQSYQASPHSPPRSHTMVRVPRFGATTCTDPSAPLTDMPRKWNWTDDENRIILSNMRRLGTQWDLVAAQLPGRTADAVRKHCHRLQKYGSTEYRKTGSAHGRFVWTAEEDRIITEGMDAFGCKWRRIAALLPRRSDSSVRNRWTRICEGPRTVFLSDFPRNTLAVKPSSVVNQISPDSDVMRDANAAPALQTAAYYPYPIDPSNNFECWQQMQMQMQQQQQQIQMQQQQMQQQMQQQQMQPQQMHSGFQPQQMQQSLSQQGTLLP